MAAPPPRLRFRTAFALTMMALASMATSTEQSVFWSTESNEKIEVQLASRQRRRFEVRARNGALPSEVFRLELQALDPQVILRVQYGTEPALERRAQLIPIERYDQSRSVPLLVEVERLDGGSEAFDLRARAIFGLSEFYEEERPPEPDWVSSSFTMTFDEVEVTPVPLGGEGPSLGVPVGIAQTDPRCRVDPLLPRNDEPEVSRPALSTTGPLFPGGTFQLEDAMWLDQVFLDDLPVSVTIPNDELLFVVPPVAGTFDVFFKGVGEPAVGLIESIEVEPFQLEAAAAWPAGSYVAATGLRREPWVATSTGQVGTHGADGFTLVRALGAKVRELRGFERPWAATSEGLFIQDGDWIAPQVRADVRRLDLLFGGEVAASEEGILVRARNEARFGLAPTAFPVRDVAVDPCRTDIWWALDDTGTVWVGGPETEWSAVWMDAAAVDVAVHPFEPNLLFVARRGPSVILEGSSERAGPELERLEFVFDRGLYGAGPEGLWRRHRGAWIQVAAWPRTKILGFHVDRGTSRLSDDGVTIYTDTGPLHVGGTPQ